MAPRPLFIADGHHRNEPGLDHRNEPGLVYRNELAAAGELTRSDDPAHFVLMMLAGRSDRGRAILPPHRLVSGSPGRNGGRLVAAWAPEFEVATASRGEVGCLEVRRDIQPAGGQDLLGFGISANGRRLLACLRSDATMDRLVPDQIPEWRAPGINIPHELELAALLAHLGCSTACLIPAAGMKPIEAIVLILEEILTQCASFFDPKLEGDPQPPEVGFLACVTLSEFPSRQPRREGSAAHRGSQDHQAAHREGEDPDERGIPVIKFQHSRDISNNDI